MSGLRFKSLLVGSSLESIAKSLRRAVKIPHKVKHPELGELFLEDHYIELALDRLIRPDSNVLDIGCHLGSFLGQAIKRAPSGAHVAIEASPSKAGWLKAKFPKVRIEQVAVSDREGIATFEENLSKPGYSRLLNSHRSTDRVKFVEVPVVTLDSLRLPRVDFVKIDIEGAELAAFRGGHQFISNNRPPILFECGADTNAGLDRMTLYDFIVNSMGYCVHLPSEFAYDKGPLGRDEFRKCGFYPFRAFNFIAVPS